MKMNNKRIVTIFSGDCFVSKNRNLIISTILGSCVAVCLYDKWAGIGGMNHFMLPTRTQDRNKKQSSHELYGLPSLQKMVKELLRAGAVNSRLEAKVFGGAKVIKELPLNIPKSNIECALDFLKQHDIKVISSDTGGEFGRKVLFDLSDFSVYVETLTNTKITQLESFINEQRNINTSSQ